MRYDERELASLRKGYNSPKRSGFDVSSHHEIDWRGDEYLGLAKRATIESMRECVKLVAKAARKGAPRWRVKGTLSHRVARKYPGGRDYKDPKPLRQTVQSGVRTRAGVVAFVRLKNGYGRFVTAGHKIIDRAGNNRGMTKPNPFLQKAFDDNKMKIMAILGRRWPKVVPAAGGGKPGGGRPRDEHGRFL